MTKKVQISYVQGMILALKSIPEVVPEKFVGALAAQFALETGFGTSELARFDNNHAGIKAGRSWKGKKSPTGLYRSYGNFREFIIDYMTVIRNMPWFQDALQSDGGMDYIEKLVNPGEPVWATDPNYIEKVRSIYNEYVPQGTESSTVEPQYNVSEVWDRIHEIEGYMNDADLALQELKKLL